MKVGCMDVDNQVLWVVNIFYVAQTTRCGRPAKQSDATDLRIADCLQRV